VNDPRELWGLSDTCLREKETSSLSQQDLKSTPSPVVRGALAQCRARIKQGKQRLQITAAPPRERCSRQHGEKRQALEIVRSITHNL
jgi:hypothetical protein